MTTWIHDALENTRLAHRVFVGFVLAVLVYFAREAAVPPSNWSRELARLENHRSQFESAILANVEQRNRDPGSLGALSESEICVRSGDSLETLSEWQQRVMRVNELQALVHVDVMLPVYPDPQCVQVEEFSVDCRREQATLTLVGGEQVEASLEVRPVQLSHDGLTLIRRYEEYGTIENATSKDALEIIKQNTLRSEFDVIPGIPIIQTSSQVLVGVMLLVLMAHLIAHLNRLRELARSGHASQMLGFPWMVTMNSRRARLLVNLMTATLIVVVPLSLLDSVRSAMPYEAVYYSPGRLELGIFVLVSIGFAWVLVVQVRLQRALPLTRNFYDAPPLRRVCTGSVPGGVRPFVGREREITLLAKLDQVYPVVVGVEGVGKTAVAHEYGRRHQADYPDGVFTIDCVDSIPASLAKLGQIALGVTYTPDTEVEVRAQMVLHALASRECLVIYDAVKDRHALLGWLPPAGHVCRVVVTSRTWTWPPPLFHQLVLESREQETK